MSLMAFRLQFLPVLAALLTGATVTTASGSNVTLGGPIIRAVRDLPHHLGSWIRSIPENACKWIKREQFGMWDVVALFAACGLVRAYKVCRQQNRDNHTGQISARNGFEKDCISVNYQSRDIGSSKLCCV